MATIKTRRILQSEPSRALWRTIAINPFARPGKLPRLRNVYFPKRFCGLIPEWTPAHAPVSEFRSAYA